MSWNSEWNAIAARIDGLVSAGQFFIQTLAINSSDAYGVTALLAKEATEIVSSLETFLGAHRGNIPDQATSALAVFLEKYGVQIKHEGVKGIDGLKLRITSLASVKSALAYHFTDFEAVAHRRAERAFLHLNQTIVADEVTRDRWNRAFADAEPACEKLGAAHLMQHGIWAFKVSAEGGRTDLVFGDPIDDADRVTGIAEALILTEWKLVRDPRTAEGVASAARDQARRYAMGILAGLELSAFRYIVLVSAEQLAEIPDVKDGAWTYRHVNVPVQPVAPSKAARKARAA